MSETLNPEACAVHAIPRCTDLCGERWIADWTGEIRSSRTSCSRAARAQGCRIIVPSEGLQGSEIRDNAFENNVKLAQKEAGTLMWIALRSRPDIAACLGVASTLITSIRGFGDT